ncbi:MAG: hypothetical protein ACTSXP_18595 [Promethearchaeota archaeon]
MESFGLTTCEAIVSEPPVKYKILDAFCLAHRISAPQPRIHEDIHKLHLKGYVGTIKHGTKI